jgi:hypothetical protein
MWSLDELGGVLSSDGIGELRRVERIRREAELTGPDLLDGSDVELLRLVMSDGDLCFLCCGETDTLEIADVPDDWDRPHVQDMSSVAPWADVVGCPLFSVWQVVTASGHHDGFQLEFGPAESPRRIQIDGAASMIRVFDVRQITA